MRKTRTQAEELELAALIAEQHADDTAGQRPQRVRAGDFVSLDAVADSQYVTQGDFADEVCDRLSGVDPDAPSPATLLVGSILADLPRDLRETYDALYVQRLSTREAGLLLGLDHSTVVRRNNRLQETIADAMSGQVSDA